MDFNIKSSYIFSLAAVIFCHNISIRASNLADNYHDNKMSIKTKDANDAKKITAQHKERIKKIKDEAASEHRTVTENAKQKKDVARKIASTTQRNTTLKSIDQETAKFHREINARRQQRINASVQLKTSQIQKSRNYYAEQLNNLQASRKAKQSKRTKSKSTNNKTNNQSTANNQIGSPRRAFSK